MASNPVQDSLPKGEEPKKQTWTEWSKEGYNRQYESYMPWVEDLYLRWFGKDNKASYATKDSLSKTKVTGIDQVDHLQDGVNDLAAGQIGKGGLLQPIGDYASKEGINRAERQGKDDKGGYAPGPLNSVANPIADGAKGAGSAVSEGAQGAGGYVKSLWGGGGGSKK